MRRPWSRGPRMARVAVADEPVAQYLADLRAGLRVAPGEAELILAEAEDHLRQSTAAGLEVGMTELEAAEAAISSFGPVHAVIRAHQRRVNRAVLRSGEAALAAWKLLSALAVAAGVTGLAISWNLQVHDAALVPAGSTKVRFHWGWGFQTDGSLRWNIFRGSRFPGWPAFYAPSLLPWLTSAAAVLAGLASLLICRRFIRRAAGRRQLLTGSSTVLAGLAGAIVATGISLYQIGSWVSILPGLIAVGLALAAGGAVKLRQARG